MPTPTPTPTPIDAWLRAATLPQLVVAALALAAYPVLAGAQVRHWATYRPLGDPDPGSLWTALRRRGADGTVFRGAGALALRQLLTLGLCAFTAAASTPSRPTERGVALQIALVLATFIAAWTATSPLAALHAARELGARPSAEGMRAAALAGAVHAALLASALLQLLLAAGFGSGPGWELAPYAAAYPLPTPADPFPRGALPFLAATVLVTVPLALLVAMPFIGAIVRLRANYNPKGVSLADDDPHYAGPQLTGVFATLRRTIAVEGWYGVYKGWAVLVLQLAIFSVVATIGVTLFVAFRPLVEHLLSYQLLVWAAAVVVPAVAAFLSLPLYVLQIRAIVTPYRVPFAPRRALRLLLSDRERASPFALYAIPGLVSALLVSAVLNSLVRIVLKDVILGPNAHFFPRPNEPPEPVTIAIAGWRWALFAALSIGLVFVLVPLDVVFTKLSVASVLPGVDEVLGESTPLVPGSSTLRLAGEEDDVVGVRPVSVAAYAGLQDALRRIPEEEGTGALFRAWEWTTVGAVLAYFSG
ncbi:hypothetical protein Q8F55_000093 [Vanrija albida]|uniref:CSC1/OSCA1-like 7TM region domain-containing protein n=1 Tax=Vanrija albida TaxID=181172 RepID=A0ABR3QCA5_9TREE